MKIKYYPKVIKRAFLLLEVMIALVVVSLAVLPLLYPHYHIYQQQKQFSHKLQLDLAAGHLYASILQKLHQNEIPWGNIEQQTSFPIDTSLLQTSPDRAPLPYQGHFKFTIKKHKQNEQYGLYLVKLSMEMNPQDKKQKSIIFDYDIFISRLFTVEKPTSSAKEEEKK